MAMKARGWYGMYIVVVVLFLISMFGYLHFLDLVTYYTLTVSRVPTFFSLNREPVTSLHVTLRFTTTPVPGGGESMLHKG